GDRRSGRRGYRQCAALAAAPATFFVPFVAIFLCPGRGIIYSPLYFFSEGRISMIFTLIAAISGLGFTQAPAPQDPIKVLVDRLDLERYKATIRGLTKFGDRREGTERNRNAIDWIEAQLKSYGCTNTERLRYQMPPAVPPVRSPAAQGRSA